MIEPEAGKVYRGKTGPARRVTSVLGLRRFAGQTIYDVVWQPLLKGGGWGKPRQCWCATWEEWCVEEASVPDVH